MIKKFLIALIILFFVVIVAWTNYNYFLLKSENTKIKKDIEELTKESQNWKTEAFKKDLENFTIKNNSRIDNVLEIEKCRILSEKAYPPQTETEQFVDTLNQVNKEVKMSDSQISELFKDNINDYKKQVYEDCINQIK